MVRFIEPPESFVRHWPWMRYVASFGTACLLAWAGVGIAGFHMSFSSIGVQQGPGLLLLALTLIGVAGAFAVLPFSRRPRNLALGILSAGVVAILAWNALKF